MATMTKNWEKESSRRGYWYRKVKKVAKYLTLEIDLFKRVLQLQANNWLLDIGRSLQIAKDKFQIKSLDEIKTYIVKREFVAIKQGNDNIVQENTALKQVNSALNQEVQAIKQENKVLQEDNISVQQEYDEVVYMVDPMMKRVITLSEEITQLVNILEKENIPYQRPEHDYEEVQTNPTTPDPEIQAPTFIPFNPRTDPELNAHLDNPRNLKRKIRLKKNIDTKRIKL